MKKLYVLPLLVLSFFFTTLIIEEVYAKEAKKEDTSKKNNANLSEGDELPDFLDLSYDNEDSEAEDQQADPKKNPLVSKNDKNTANSKKSTNTQADAVNKNQEKQNLNSEKKTDYIGDVNAPLEWKPKNGVDSPTTNTNSTNNNKVQPTTTSSQDNPQDQQNKRNENTTNADDKNTKNLKNDSILTNNPQTQNSLDTQPLLPQSPTAVEPAINPTTPTTTPVTTPTTTQSTVPTQPNEAPMAPQPSAPEIQMPSSSTAPLSTPQLTPESVQLPANQNSNNTSIGIDNKDLQSIDNKINLKSDALNNNTSNLNNISNLALPEIDTKSPNNDNNIGANELASKKELSEKNDEEKTDNEKSTKIIDPLARAIKKDGFEKNESSSDLNIDKYYADVDEDSLENNDMIILDEKPWFMDWNSNAKEKKKKKLIPKPIYEELSPLVYKREYEQSNKHLTTTLYKEDYEMMLFDAIANKNNIALSYIIDLIGDTEIKMTNSGDTPLIFAIKNYNNDAVRVLLARGARIYSDSDNMSNALQVATSVGNEDAFKAISKILIKE